MDSAYAWQHYYRAERTRMGPDVLRALVDEAVPLETSPGGAVIVPHTRMEVTGGQIARAVSTVIASGFDRVLALGVLHGGRRSDRVRVEAARAGDAHELALLRRVHEPSGLASEEFSLDGFVELLDIAARLAGRSIDIVCRYPYFVGDEPSTLTGIDELERLIDDGSFLVATTDPIHHGHAYGTPPDRCLEPDEPDTIATSGEMINAQLAALSAHRYAEFRQLTAQHQSDFRDTGPVVAHLVGEGFEWTVHDLALVDYSTALHAEAPSWVAGALITI